MNKLVDTPNFAARNQKTWTEERHNDEGGWKMYDCSITGGLNCYCACVCYTIIMKS